MFTVVENCTHLVVYCSLPSGFGHRTCKRGSDPHTPTSPAVSTSLRSHSTCTNHVIERNRSCSTQESLEVLLRMNF